MAALGSSYEGGCVAQSRGLRVGVSLLALPELCVEQAEEEGFSGDAAKSGAGESGLGVGKVAHAEAGEQAKCSVERRNVEAGERAEEAGGWEGEVADEPERAGGELRGEAGGEGVDLGLGEAVEQEVR